MPKTAVGLFRDSKVVEDVIGEIQSLGFPRNELRALAEQLEPGVTGVTSIPRVDFEVALTRELIRIGAGKAEAEGWVEGVRDGGVLVFATGSDDTVDTAAEVMNRHGALKVDETAGPEPQLPRMAHPSMTPIRESPVQAGRILEPTDGAAFFIW